MHWESFTCYIKSWQPWTAPYIVANNLKAPAKEQICTMYVPSQSVFMIYLRVRWHIPHIFRSCSLPVLTGVAMHALALLHSELDNLTYNWTSRHTGYTFTWPRPTVEPAWVRSIEKTTGSLPHGRPRVRSGNCYPSHGVVLSGAWSPLQIYCRYASFTRDVTGKGPPPREMWNWS